MAAIDSSAPFTTLSHTPIEGGSQVKLSLQAGRKVNDVLQYMLPLVSITRLEEVIPTMNEIFIQTVSKKSN
jgi:ABC-2 type transport system ATP-binding protein